MKQLLLLSAVLLTFLYSSGQTVQYDSTLAKKLGADEYGMKNYIFVILKTGPNKINDTKILDSLFTGHLNNITRLADEGKLIVAGPFGKNEKTYRGLFILNVTSFEEAEKLLQTDPTIKEKVLVAEMYNWYGSAALPSYLEVHRKIEKSKPQ